MHSLITGLEEADLKITEAQVNDLSVLGEAPLLLEHTFINLVWASERDSSPGGS